MSHKVEEVQQPRSATKSSAGFTKERLFFVLGTGITSPEEAIDASGIPRLGSRFPDFNMIVTNIRAEAFDDDINKWKVTVSYARPEIKDGATAGRTSQVSFDTGTQTTHIIQAVTPTPADKSFAKGGEDAPLSEGLIGWDGEKAQGVDIQDGQFTFTVTRRYTNAEIDVAYILILSNFAYKTNEEPWSEWKAGEILYTGAQARNTSGSRVTIEGDEVGMFSEAEKITGVTSENTDNGILYLSIEQTSGGDDFLEGEFHIKLFKDPALGNSDLVAQAPIAVIGTVLLAEANGSGIAGTIQFDSYEFDTDQIILVFPFPWEISYNYAVILNEDAFVVGEINVQNKLGWEYADVQYSANDQIVGMPPVTRTVQAAKYVYLHEVYQKVKFSEFLIDDKAIFP